MSIIPDKFLDLLEKPYFGSLATVSPKGAAHSSIMWYVWDGEVVSFTHTTTRQKYRNLQVNPSAAISIYDPQNPARYIEVRGHIEEIVPDSDGVFFEQLYHRYGADFPLPVDDYPDRVILRLRPQSVHTMG